MWDGSVSPTVRMLWAHKDPKKGSDDHIKVNPIYEGKKNSQIVWYMRWKSVNSPFFLSSQVKQLLLIIIQPS